MLQANRCSVESHFPEKPFCLLRFAEYFVGCSMLLRILQQWLSLSHGFSEFLFFGRKHMITNAKFVFHVYIYNLNPLNRVLSSIGGFKFLLCVVTRTRLWSWMVQGAIHRHSLASKCHVYYLRGGARGRCPWSLRKRTSKCQLTAWCHHFTIFAGFHSHGGPPK